MQCRCQSRTSQRAPQGPAERDNIKKCSLLLRCLESGEIKSTAVSANNLITLNNLSGSSFILLQSVNGYNALAMIGIIEVLHKSKSLHLIVLRHINYVSGLNIIPIMCLLATDNSQDSKADKKM